jgi:hypothetical protein
MAWVFQKKSQAERSSDNSGGPWARDPGKVPTGYAVFPLGGRIKPKPKPKPKRERERERERENDVTYSEPPLWQGGIGLSRPELCSEVRKKS